MDLSRLEKVKSDADVQVEADMSAAKHYLGTTDWYVIRQVETGAAVPVEVAKQRAEARSVLAGGA